MRLAVLSALLMFVCVCDASDRKRERGRGRGRGVRVTAQVTAYPATHSVSSTLLQNKVTAQVTITGTECRNAMDEVNADRARHGLAAFSVDLKLCEAAYSAALNRAQSHNAGHTANDFAFLPAGAHATAAGCGAWEPGSGWGTCCMHDSYQTAGAAWVIGSDGKRYMHLFVR